VHRGASLSEFLHHLDALTLRFESPHAGKYLRIFRQVICAGLRIWRVEQEMVIGSSFGLMASE